MTILPSSLTNTLSVLSPITFIINLVSIPVSFILHTLTPIISGIYLQIYVLKFSKTTLSIYVKLTQYICIFIVYNCLKCQVYAMFGFENNFLCCCPRRNSENMAVNASHKLVPFLCQMTSFLLRKYILAGNIPNFHFYILYLFLG